MMFLMTHPTPAYDAERYDLPAHERSRGITERGLPAPVFWGAGVRQLYLS